MEVKAQTLTIERKGFWRPEVVIRDAEGREVTLARRTIRTDDGAEFDVAVRGRCRRVHTLRDMEGRLVATALPLKGARGFAYEIAMQGGERYTIRREKKGWFRRGAIVVAAGEREVLRFERRGLAQQTGPLACAAAAFFVYLQQLIQQSEAAMTASAASAAAAAGAAG